MAIGTAPPGPGLDPDAMSYLGAAESLVRSHTLRVPTSGWASPDSTRPLSHFPPGFSIAIAIPTALGVRPAEAARIVILAAAFATWSMLVLLVSTVVSSRVAVLAAFAALAAPAIVNVHLSVLSEPLFFCCLLAAIAGVLALERRAPADSTPPYRDLWIALLTGMAVAVAVMLRYAAIALAAAACLHAVWGGSQCRPAWPVRLRRAAAIVLPSAAVLAAWFVRTVRVSGAHGVRRLGTYGDVGATVSQGLETITAWLVPVGQGAWRYPVACLVALGTAAVVVRGWTRLRETNPAAVALLRILATMAGCYFLVVVASRLFADPSIPFDERILSPLILLATIGLAVLLSAWWPDRSRGSRVVAGSVLVLWAGASAVTSAARIAYARDDGNDFAGSDWRGSPTIAWARAADGGAHSVLYSNWPSALYFHAHRAAHDIPASADGLTLHRFRDRLLRTHGVVVGFKAPSPDVVDPDTLARALSLRAVARFEDGTVWALPADTAPLPK